MPQLIKHPLTLESNSIKLLPLEKEHFESLLEAASNPEIWELTSVNYSIPEVFHTNSNTALADRDKGSAYPFVIIDTKTNEIIGTTRFLEIVPADKKLEIGVTWIKKEYWGSTVNLECKFIMLQYCFEVLKTVRVQFRAKSNNARSRKAMENMGAHFEGIMRKDKIEANGIPRDTAFYSIIDSEWEQVKEKITNLIASKKL
ncbi:GNAT family N-acetyltransferase [Flavobacterium amniphilum]|uniref:GNAT family N-acetyltransferase n=1 Tax=Flavobacterium amniphilum TaxID=1834035 RepID=UPI00202AB6FC|nr:GNAT family protein [Flavobacterium amniphilum]MCL9805508.1 GNAT family N-acetyltransferase [Flavobacterium amniphilum]